MYGCNVATQLHTGSSTAVVLKLVEDMTLETANLGDSGFAIFRVQPDNSLTMVYKSQPAQFAFNMPH